MVYLFLADGFEMTEALVPLDILRRGGVEVKTVSVSGEKNVISTHGVSVEADIPISSVLIKEESLEGIILPGGMPGAQNLDGSPELDMILRVAYELAKKKKIIISAICAAPFVLGKRGMLEGKRAICYPGFEKYLTGAKIETKSSVVSDGNTITAKAMGVSHEFGFALLTALRTQEAAEKVRKSVFYGN